jgi:hypothetical protein
MSNAIGRFLSFEETLGKGLVKFAYYVLLAALAVMTLGLMIGAIGTMIDGDVLEGLGLFILAPIRFAIAVIVLRVLAELVLAVLSIDDSLAPEGRNDAGMPSLRSGNAREKEPHQTAPFAAGGAGGSGGLTKTSLPHGDTEASRGENQRAPFADEPVQPEGEGRLATRTSLKPGKTEAADDANQRAPFADDAAKPKEGLTKTSLPHGDTEAGHPANEKAPFAADRPETQNAGAKKEETKATGTAEPGGSAYAASDVSAATPASGDKAAEAKRADLKSSAEPSTNETAAPGPARKTTKRTTKKTTKKTASSTKKTVDAANDSPASARSDDAKKTEDKPGPGGGTS